jgi:hypothetical protein
MATTSAALSSLNPRYLDHDVVMCFPLHPIRATVFAAGRTRRSSPSLFHFARHDCKRDFELMVINL